MGIRTGEQLLQSLRDDRLLFIDGARVKDVTTDPRFASAAQSLAELYDMQHDAALIERMTFLSPTSGERVGLSFVVPRTREDLERRRAMMLQWARATCGMMGRSPDFMNVTFAAWAGAADYFARSRPAFGANIRRYYEHIRERDLTLTHALINLQRSRTMSGVVNAEEGTALQVIRETDAGVIVRGARVLATLAPFSDEIAVYSPRVAQLGDAHSPFALNFALPVGAPGLRFLCRESFDLGRPAAEHPLGARFDEMDCVAFFDDVLVPWERVFLLGDVALVNGTGIVTGSSVHSAHQNAVKNLAKCEFVLGVALLMTKTLGTGSLPHSEERLGELMMYTELIRACVRAAEADAALDEWGVMRPAVMPAEITRNLFTTAYPRMVEILQLLGSSSFMITPGEADFAGPLKPAIEQYLATDTASARERVTLFRLAWDIAGSAFGGRQVLYERFFASDPLSRARFLGAIYPKDELMRRVRDFLDRDL
ncbi:MAG TPA: 4-hydroxyphenylacetate 3-monooxygenase, oxygenase component [Methylomirabilota bacterium]|nr:4-hydroxyphenylacetate 3-monooxygenase, oxygenase component [Methylomirabilota bacterium]